MHKISLIAVLPCGNVTIFHVVEILKYGLLYVFITQFELIHEVAHTVPYMQDSRPTKNNMHRRRSINEV